MKGYIPPVSARSDGSSGKKQEGGEFHLSEQTGCHKRREHNFLLGGKNNNTLGYPIGRREGRRIYDALLLSSLLGREGM
jgi:hypothetical protein